MITLEELKILKTQITDEKLTAACEVLHNIVLPALKAAPLEMFETCDGRVAQVARDYGLNVTPNFHTTWGVAYLISIPD